MEGAREKILVVEGEGPARGELLALLQGAGYEVLTAASIQEGLDAARAHGVDLLLLDAGLPRTECCDLLTELKGSAATQSVRVLLFTSGGSGERVLGLDLGADDALSRPWDAAELLARVRVQLRAKRAQHELREKTRIAEEGQQIAHTAFQALAVTEKMTRDAFSLGRALRVGVAAAFIVAAVMAAVFFLYSRRAEKETRRAYAVIAQLERGLASQQHLVERARKMRAEMERNAADSMEKQRQQLEQQSKDLQARMAGADASEVAKLRQQFAETNTRLRRIEAEGKIAQGIIQSYAPSVCLLHVVVGFRDRDSGKRLRYAGINPQGEPLQDSDGNPLYDLEGRGPEVRADFFGTGFVVAADGRILTNRHVAQPSWKNDELAAVAQQGLEPVIAEISAYFPGVPRGVRVEIQKISPDADLALVQGNLEGLKRAVLVLERNGGAVSGQPVVLLGYATGLDAILARAGEDTVRDLVSAMAGDPKQIMVELARRNLIRPIATQGHIGDVLPDKIIYDAQTASGGSGGPVFSQQGKVIGINFAVVRGFGGSNFGIPIRFAGPLLSP